MKKLSILLLGAIIGFAACYLYLTQQNDLTKTMKPPKGLITASQAKTLDKGFNGRHQLISDSILKRPDNRSSWFSLSDIRDYLDYAENQSKENGYEMNGIRIYNGAYPTTKEDVGYSTSFIVPTTIGVNGNERSGGNKDIPGVDGLNDGDPGFPPEANYPQQ